MTKIRLFLSGEVDSDIGHEKLMVSNQVEKQIQTNILDQNDYGDSIEILGVIPTILGERFTSAGVLSKERKLVKHKNKSTDIRLKIDHAKFKDGTEDERRKLLLENIIKSIRIVGGRVKKGFDSEKLEADIRKEFNYYDIF